MEFEYSLTLISIKLKNRQRAQMIVTNRRSNLQIKSHLVDENYVFNETFTITEGRKNKQHIQLLINFVNEKGVSFIGGTILINRFQLVPSEDILTSKISNCLDQKASCQFVVNSISPIERKSPQKSYDQSTSGRGLSTYNSQSKHKSTIIPNIFNSPTNSFSGHKSTKSVSQRSFESQDEYTFSKLQKELAQYKILLKNQRERVKELLEEVQRIEELRLQEKKSKLKLEFLEQEWIAQKSNLIFKLKRSQQENKQTRQVYLKQIQELKQIILGLKTEPKFFKSLTSPEKKKVSFEETPFFKTDEAWKKKKIEVDKQEEKEDIFEVKVISPKKQLQKCELLQISKGRKLKNSQ